MRNIESTNWRLPSRLTTPADRMLMAAKRRMTTMLTVLLSVFSFSLLTGGVLAATIGDGSSGGTLGLILIFSAILILVVGILLIAGHAIPPHPAAVGGFMAAVLFLVVLAFVVPSIYPATASVVSAPPAAQLSSYIVLPAQTGCSLNTITNTVTCTLMYNSTSNYLAVAATNVSGHVPTAALAGWILVGFHSARVDALNSTYGFNYQVASIPTITSVGATPTVYSPTVGYIAATSTASGVWKMFWGSGSAANLNPLQAAPSITTGFTPSQVGIASFGSATDYLHLSLPGTNSTSFPTTAYSALTAFGSYTSTVTIQNSTPITFTLVVTIIGENT